MKALRCIICSALLCGSCNLASATRIPDADEWYGIHLGSRAPGQPDHDRAIARQTISLPVPKPWQWVFVNTDDAGRMCVLIFGDRGVDRWTDMPPGQIPKRIKSKQMMKADAAAVLAYATAKLGRPDKTGGDDRGSDERRFEWTRKDKAGVIRAASLSVSDEAIFLIINPSIGVTDTMELEPKPIEYEAGDCRGSSNTV